MTTSRSSWIRVLVLLAFMLIASLAYASWPTLSSMLISANLMQLTAGVLALSVANICMSLVFVPLVHRNVTQEHAAEIIAGTFLLSQVAKYIPGRIWGVAMQTLMLGSPKAAGSMLTVNLELAIINVVLVTGAGCAFLALSHVGALAALLVLAITYCMALWAIRANGLQQIFVLISSRIPRLAARFPFLAVKHTIGARKTAITCKIGLAGYLVMYSIGWFLLAWVLVSLDADKAIRIVALLSLSYVAGVASMLPAGLGAREAVLVLLAPLAGVPQIDMAAFAVITRAAMLLMDAITAVVGVVMLREHLVGKTRHV